MKFTEYESTKDDYGFEFAKNNIMKTSKPHVCGECGCVCNFVEVLCEGYYCSDECVDKFYEKYNEHCRNLKEQ